MTFLKEFVRDCWTVVVPMLVIIAVVPALWATGHREASWAVSNVGSALVMLGNVVYIVLRHSVRRWPGTTARQRLRNLFGFKR